MAVTYIAVDLIVLLLVSFVKLQASLSEQNCSVLYLLNVQPFPDSTESIEFDGGLNLIPAAHLAAEEINNRSDILPGYHLEVIDIEAEECGRDIITKGLVNLYKELVSQECIVGVMGFPCSTSTNLLAPIVGHPDIGYITLANSVSPAHRDITKYPNLFHTLSSTSVHNIAIVTLMRKLKWKRIGLVYNSRTIFHRSTSADFAQRIESDDLPDTNLTTNIAITGEQDIKKTFNEINSAEARITYWLGSDSLYAFFLCEAYQRNFIWPGFVYILRNTPDNIADILETKTSCSYDEMLLAIEGVFFLDYRLHVDDDTELCSGWTYSQFRRRYANRLNEFAGQIDMNLTEIIFANSFYDQVWTFALAINNSLPSIYSQNLSFADYTFMNTKTISNNIKRELMNLSFQGATGRVHFNKNYEIPSSVDIFQVQRGSLQRVAVYDPSSMNITQNENFPHDIPPDTFETFYNLLPFWLGGCILGAQGLLFVVITTNLVLILVWRKVSEIKAISPLLSILMMIGCYCLCAAPVFLVVYRMFPIENSNLVTTLCFLKTWSSVGIELILATLFWKILRIHHIFHEKNMTLMSKYWMDKYLFLYSILICIGKVVLLISWSAQSQIRADYIPEYIPDGPNQLPHYMVTVRCSISTSWFIASLIYTAILLFLVVVLAVETRHIKNSMYKDTKKISIFIFLTVLLLATTITISIFFTHIGNELGANISEWLAYFSVSVLCQVCLFVPKTLPQVIRRLPF